MGWRTSIIAAGHLPEQFGQIAFSPDSAAYIQALVFGGHWDGLSAEQRADVLQAAAHNNAGRLGAAWVIGHHDILLSRAIVDATERTAYRAVLLARDPGALERPALAALLDDAAPTPTDDDSLNWMLQIGELHPPAFARIAVRLAMTDLTDAAAQAWLRCINAIVSMPTVAVRVTIALHHSGAWERLESFAAPDSAWHSGLMTLQGAIARSTQATTECALAGALFPLLERAIPDDAVTRVMRALIERWDQLNETQRQMALRLAVRNEEAAITLARRIGPSDDLASAACGSVEGVIRYLTAIAPFHPPAEHIDALMRTAPHITPSVAELVGLHPRVVYESIGDPQRAAQALVFAVRSPYGLHDAEAVAMLRAAALKNAQAAALALRALGAEDEGMLRAAVAHPDGLIDAIDAIHSLGVQPPPLLRDAVARHLEEGRDDRLASLVVALWDDVDEPTIRRACATAACARRAIRTAVERGRWERINPSMRDRLAQAAVQDDAFRLDVISLIGDYPTAWQRHMEDARARAMEVAAPMEQRKTIAIAAADYLSALVAHGSWERIPWQRRSELLQPCLQDGAGIALAIQIVGPDPEICNAMYAVKDKRPIDWAEALRNAPGDRPPPPAAVQAVADNAGRSARTAAALTALLGWRRELLAIVTKAPYGDSDAFVQALRHAGGIGDAVRDLASATTWSPDEQRLIEAIVMNMQDGDVDSVAQALTYPDVASLSLSMAHPCLAAAYAQRFPQVMHDRVYRAALLAGSTAAHPTMADDVDDVDLAPLLDAIDMLPWNICAALRIGIVPSDASRILTRSDLALTFMRICALHHIDPLLPAERTALIMTIANDPAMRRLAEQCNIIRFTQSVSRRR